MRLVEPFFVGAPAKLQRATIGMPNGCAIIEVFGRIQLGPWDLVTPYVSVNGRVTPIFFA